MDPLIPVGGEAPGFHIPDRRGQTHSLRDMLGKVVVLNFWSAECEWCERVDRELTPYLLEWEGKAWAWWIAANAGEARPLIEKVAAERKLPTVLLDQHQQVANLYGAQTTPHFFIVDRTGKLAYQGAWDDITFRQRVATRVYVPRVVEALINNLQPEITLTPPYGCALVREYETG